MLRGRIGVDLVPLERVRELASQDGSPLLRRMLTAEELNLAYDPTRPDIPGIAGRIAAKEAVFKLFRSSGETLPWLDTRILKAPGGRPTVHLAGRAARLATASGLGPIEVSISHDGPYAMAVACSLGPDPEATDRHHTPDDHASGGIMASNTIGDVHDWILSKHPERTSIAPDENLVDSRLVDSLSFVELVYIIESASGVEVDFDAIDMKDFQTLSSIEKAFFH